MTMTVDPEVGSDNKAERLGEISEREVFFLLRKRARISQHALAAEAGITQSYLSAWESGRWSPPDKRSQEYWDALDRLIARREVTG